MKARGLLISLAVSASVGCVATAAPAPSRGVVVNGPPPAPLREERSAPPGPNAAWVDGYWHWTGGRYAWIPGHWESAPPGATWYGPRYVTQSDGTITYEPGAWKHAASTNALR